METTMKSWSRATVYFIVEKVGLAASLLGAMMFIGGPLLWCDEKIPHTLLNGAILTMTTLISGGIGVALYFLHEHLTIRWKDKM